MYFVDWLYQLLQQAIPPVAVIGALVFFARNLILTRLSKSVGYEFDSKIEKVRSEFRASEEQLKADLHAKENEIAALRGGAMNALTSRQIEVDKRALVAIEQLWAAAGQFRAAKMVINLMAMIKFDAVVVAAETDAKVREWAKALGFGFDLTKLDLSEASKSQLFAPPMAWAIYSAIAAVTAHAFVRWQMIVIGVGPANFVEDDALLKLVKAALPHQASYIDNYGHVGAYHLVEELEERLLKELQSSLTGKESDKAALAQASEIIRLANEVREQSAEKPETPLSVTLVKDDVPSPVAKH